MNRLENYYYVDNHNALNTVYTTNDGQKYVLVTDSSGYGEFLVVDETKLVTEEKAKRIYPEFFV